MRFLRWLDEIAICQHRDPIRFFDEVQRRGVWRCLWPYRLGLIGLCALLIGLVAWLADPVFRPWVILTPLLLIFGLIALFGVITIPTGTLTTATEWLGFWSLYGFSAPFLCILLLSALAAFPGPAFVLSFLIGLPIFLLFMAVDAGALVVCLSAQQEGKKRDQFRAGGPIAHGLEMPRQRLVFRLRFASAALLLLAGAAVLLIDGLGGWQGALFLVIAAAASLRGEATLLALAGLPLARFDGEHLRWRAAYCGRNGLLLPARTLRGALRRVGHPASQSSILLALLTESAAAPFISRGLRRMDDAEIGDILLHLSLRPGAADALRLFAPHLSPAQARLAGGYARLAEEAANPPDLQRWLGGLAALTASDEGERLHPVLELLAQARAALASYTHNPQVEQALSGMQEFVAELEEESAKKAGEGLETGVWPRALLRHLQVHRRALVQGKGKLAIGEGQ
ncbi:MAG: hypothetical protein HY328_00885 [Chloroflexi bacterium]|nr:hypothetical protein [Chloroflexota bacterium]